MYFLLFCLSFYLSILSTLFLSVCLAPSAFCLSVFSVCFSLSVFLPQYPVCLSSLSASLCLCFSCRDRHTDTRIKIHTETQTQTGRQTGRRADRQTDRHRPPMSLVSLLRGQFVHFTFASWRSLGFAYYGTETNDLSKETYLLWTSPSEQRMSCDGHDKRREAVLMYP